MRTGLLALRTEQQNVFWLEYNPNVETQLGFLGNVEKIIAAHHAFISELEKATFEMSVSWEVEPNEADKKLAASLTVEQKTVHAVVPASQ